MNGRWKRRKEANERKKILEYGMFPTKKVMIETITVEDGELKYSYEQIGDVWEYNKTNYLRLPFVPEIQIRLPDKAVRIYLNAEANDHLRPFKMCRKCGMHTPFGELHTSSECLRQQEILVVKARELTQPRAS